MNEMTPQMLSRFANLLANTLPVGVVADLLNEWVAIEGNDTVSDDDAANATTLFHYLTAECPDAVSLAVGMGTPPDEPADVVPLTECQ